jgi:hypothetical protein
VILRFSSFLLIQSKRSTLKKTSLLDISCCFGRLDPADYFDLVAKVHKQSNLLSRRLQVIDKLHLMDPC